jgi:tagatose 1,6-diphosphate aldolase
VSAPAADRARRLRSLADESGIVVGFAFDHRDSLDVVLHELGLGALTPDEIRDLKEAIVRAIAPAASVVMLDHDYGQAAIGRGAIPPGVGLVMPLEAQGYAQLGDERRTTLLSDFSPTLALALGADACKLLLPLRPDRAPFLEAQLEVARRAVAAAHAVGLPILLEPQVYRVSTETPEEFRARVTGLTTLAVELVAAVGSDLLKLPFPTVDGPDDPGADERARIACVALDSAASGIPWVLYGAGVPTDTFTWQLRHAGAAGACGFLVGRTVWRDALDSDREASAAVARDTCVPRFAGFGAIARATCRPLRELSSER